MAALSQNKRRVGGLDGCAGSRLLTPRLPPHELQTATRGKVFLDGVVHPLDEHAGQVGPLQEVGHGGTVPEGVNRPP